MSFISRYKTCVLALILAVFIGGCSQIEPQTGTRVTFAIDSSKPLTRPQVAQLCRYLVKKSDLALDADRARIDSVDKTALVLLLPGKKIDEKKVSTLLEGSSFEFVHLDRVVTGKHPERPWKMSLPDAKRKSYEFTDSKDSRLNSADDSGGSIKDSVVMADYKPILTDADLEPTAMYQQTKQGWALLIRFNKAGAEKLDKFSTANRGEYLAVFDDGQLVSAALISEPIKGGEVFLTGFSTEDQVNGLVTDINGGDLPARLRVESVEYY